MEAFHVVKYQYYIYISIIYMRSIVEALSCEITEQYLYIYIYNIYEITEHFRYLYIYTYIIYMRSIVEAFSCCQNNNYIHI